MSDRSAKNRLADEASPYLQQHGSNPVDWYPWGDEALLRAKREDKPIFLSIGYSACHWCHVMERESFEDETTARVLNEGFVAIKVDREERPDLDQIYQLVVQLMGRSGGWPLSVFLTPDKKPFFGGTYFPPVERYGMPSFTQVLAALSDAYKERRGEVSDQADEITKAITRALSDDGAKGDRDASKDSARLGPDLLARVAKRLGARFDGKNGGFGSRPKFPNTMSLDVLLRRGAQENDVLAIAQVTMALDAMRAGGIHDHVGGGFHRYSTDERWLVPHFEKMLYDNSLLLRLYVDAARACEGTERHREVARSIAEYVAREMTSPEGGFYASQDADSEGEEGKFFVWSPDEVREVLGKDDVAMRAALLRFGVTDEGNFEETKKSVLYEAKTMREVADALGVSEEDAEVAISRAKKALFEAREKREKPFRDEKILVSWNGMMIGAMAEAGAALADDAMIARAARAFDHVERALVSGEGDALTIARLAKGDRVRGPGFLDDYALLADAALDLYEATGDARYALRAREVARAMLSRFHAKGDFFYTPHDGEALIVRAKDAYDNAVPSGASVAMRVLLRLGALADESMETIARESLERAASSAIETPSGYGHTLGSLDRLVRGSVDVVLVGARTDPRTRALARVVHERYLPNRTLAWLDPTDARSREACARLAEGKRAEGAPVAYVCRGRTCSSPVDTAFALQALLTEGA